MGLEAIPTPGGEGTEALVTPVRSRTLAKDDAIGLVALTAAALFSARSSGKPEMTYPLSR
jgi:hypothetical protein